MLKMESFEKDEEFIELEKSPARFSSSSSDEDDQEEKAPEIKLPDNVGLYKYRMKRKDMKSNFKLNVVDAQNQ